MEVTFIFDSLFQGSYEAAVESGVKNQAACKRTKQILQIRKQDSYTKAIGGSFEDDHGSEGKGGGGEPAVKMRKQESYLMAVGELVSLGFFLAFKMVSRKIFYNTTTTSNFLQSPEEYTMNFGNKSNQPSTTRIKKQDSYLQAIGNTEDELTPLPKRASVRKQESYQRAMMAGGVGSFTQGKIRFSSRSITSISQITNRQFFGRVDSFFKNHRSNPLFCITFLTLLAKTVKISRK